MISGHNDIYGEVFRDLPDLSVGDEVVVHTLSASHRYVVEQTRDCGAYREVSVMDGTARPCSRSFPVIRTRLIRTASW